MVEIIGKVFCTNVIFQCLVKVDKLLILPITHFVTYLTDITFSFTLMPSPNFHFLEEK